MSRRLVTVLFLDLVGWTALAERVDPEPLQELLERYYEICSNAVQEHGGLVEKFIGDAVMAVFGADASREDDAQRALRTAARIRADVGLLRPPAGQDRALEVHCGLAAGEALVTRSARAGIRVVGDVVNLAARLQSAAGAGETLVNETLANLAGPRHVLTRMPPMPLKGKAEPVTVLRVDGESDPDAERSARVPRLVDRGAESDRLLEAYRRVERERRAGSVAVLGPAGIGKTRLVRETVERLAASGTGPSAVFGTCPSYGARGPYAALVEVLEGLLRQLPLEPDEQVAAVLNGLRDQGAGAGVEEVAWAARELLTAAVSRPVVVVWDALEYAGPSLLALISELVHCLRGLPVLTVCVGRSDASGAGGPWPLGSADEVIDLGALPPADGARLALELFGDRAEEQAEVRTHSVGVADRVAAYSAGNPLYIRLMVEWLGAGGAVDDVPPTITAMVGAMIDRLPEHAARLLGAASVIGPTFTLEQLVLLGEREPDAGVAVLDGLRLVRTAKHGGEYRFVQQPVHEVAYARLEKETRVAGHRRLAEHGVNPAFHYEAALRLLADLRPDDAALPALARRAAEALLEEGTATLRQRDLPTSTGLLERALAVANGVPGPLRATVAVRLSDALMLSGDTRRALEVVEGRAEPGEGPGSALCLAQRQVLRMRLGEVAEADVEPTRAELEAAGADRSAWCRFEQLRMLIHLEHGRYGAAEASVCEALEHARAVGDGYETDRLLVARCEVRQWSPTPVADELAGCAELLERFAADRFLLLPALVTQARCLALIGASARAREAVAEARAVTEQLRLTMGAVLVDHVAGLIYSLEGDHAEAQRRFRAAADALDAAGYAPAAVTSRVLAARECMRDGLLDEATERINRLMMRRNEMDLRGRVLCAAAAARLAAERDRADPTLDQLPVLLAESDDPCLRGEVRFDLACALRRLGHEAAASAQAESAAADYAAAGATRPLEMVRSWM